MLRFLAALPFLLLVLLLASCLGNPAFAVDVAPAGATPVVVPWGEWTVAIVNSVVMPILLPLVAMLAAWIFAKLAALAPWLANIVTQKRIEDALTRCLDYGVNAVRGAAKDKKLEVDTGRAVLNAAIEYAAREVPPRVLAAAGDLPGFATKAFRKMYLDEAATAENVLRPIVAGIASNTVIVPAPGARV
jgi:hypothetical protein